MSVGPLVGHSVHRDYASHENKRLTIFTMQATIFLNQSSHYVLLHEDVSLASGHCFLLRF